MEKNQDEQNQDEKLEMKDLFEILNEFPENWYEIYLKEGEVERRRPEQKFFFDYESCKPSPNARMNYCILYDDIKCPKTCEYAQEKWDSRNIWKK